MALCALSQYDRVSAAGSPPEGIISRGELVEHACLPIDVRDPAKAILVPHVEEVKWLKSALNRKKKMQAPETPAPTPKV